MGVSEMLCAVTKWFISRSLDRNKGMPVLLRRHVQKCASCRAFQQAALQIQSRAAREALPVFKNIPKGLSERIKSRVFEPDDSRQKVYRLLKHHHSRWLLPAASTAAAAALLAVVFIVQPFQNQPAAPGNGEFSLFNALIRPAEEAKKVSLEVESPYERELESLRKAARTAARHVLDRLDLRIGS
jgi:hypothetical protein